MLYFYSHSASISRSSVMVTVHMEYSKPTNVNVLCTSGLILKPDIVERMQIFPSFLMYKFNKCCSSSYWEVLNTMRTTTLVCVYMEIKLQWLYMRFKSWLNYSSGVHLLYIRLHSSHLCYPCDVTLYNSSEFASEYVESTNDKWLAATFMQQRLSRKK